MYHIESKQQLLHNLNDSQIQAVTNTQGPLLILAGAGSGKTTVITRRIAWLIEQEKIAPESILAMTFTNKSAEEMIDRVKHLVTIKPKHFWISTFHSFCTKLLRIEGERTLVGKDFVIFDTSEQRSAIKKILTEFNLSDKQFHPKKVLEVISDFKNRCLLPSDLCSNNYDSWTNQVINIYINYQNLLTKNHACDFDDLLLYTERLFRNQEIQQQYADVFKYILVDEYQDTNRAQYLLIRHLANHHNNICVVGDEDQSIYGWRGANINNILDFRKDFPNAKQIKLEQNYRSTQKILNAASIVIANNTQRIGKTLWTDLSTGQNITIKILNNGYSEAEFIVRQICIEHHKEPNTKIAVLYRANWQSRQIEEALRSENIPYKLLGGTKFYERQEIKDIVSYLRFINNNFDLISFKRSISAPTRGIGLITIAKIEASIPYDCNILSGIESILMNDNGIIKGKSKQELSKYFELINQAIKQKHTLGISKLIRWIIDKSGYKSLLELEGTLEADSRLNNLEEFISAAYDAENLGLNLADFIDRISLTSDSDNHEETANLSLMTIHCAKGLEFPVVFLAGMEEDTFPNRRAQEVSDGIEEERRLFYVAMTRAKHKLYLTSVKKRRIMNRETVCTPSRFLYELPKDGVDSSLLNANNICTQIKLPRQINNVNHCYLYEKNSLLVKNIDKSQIDIEKKNTAAMKKGTKVMSQHFGQGTITSISGSGDNITYTIRFAVGEKRIMAKFGMLYKINH